MKKARPIMIQGTMSNAGKSILCTALCRILAQDGYSVAPFKSQNMALNSYITKDGLEMGRAQVAQAEAAYKKPSADMNPILLKPTTDVGSQVIVNGRVYGNMRASEYFAKFAAFRLKLFRVDKENCFIKIFIFCINDFHNLLINAFYHSALPHFPQSIKRYAAVFF